jgi:hypothetical protein
MTIEIANGYAERLRTKKDRRARDRVVNNIYVKAVDGKMVDAVAG